MKIALVDSANNVCHSLAILKQLNTETCTNLEMIVTGL